MSGWPLSEAIARCLARRGRAGLRSAPVPVAFGVGAFVAAPLLMARAGSALGDVIAPALDDVRSTRILVATIVALAALGGAAISVALPSRDGLGDELATTPLTERRLLWATWVVPLALVFVAAAPTVLGLLLSFAASSPGGWATAPALVVAGLAGALLGAAVAEVGRLVVCGDAVGTVGVAALGCCWLGAGALAGTAALGPLDALAGALAGRDAMRGALVGLVVCVGALTVWASCATRARGSRAPQSPRLRVPAWRRPALVVVASVLVLLSRRRDVRVGLLLSAAAAAATLTLGRAGGAPWDVGVPLAAMTAALAAVPLPLAAGGALIDGRWHWQTAPRHSATVAAGWCAAAVGGLALVVAAVVFPAVAVLDVGRSSVGPVFLGAAMVAACALATGALVPCRDAAMGDQIPSIAALVVVLATAGVLAGEVGTALADAGAPEALAAATPVGVVLAIAWWSLAVRAARVA